MNAKKKTKAKTATKPKKAAKTPDKPGKLSALDAAAKVMGDTKQPMTCKELVQAMADKGYWTSPGGKTPHATLFSALTREINTKGKEARFKKADRGKFSLA